jgi:hypothetical protein
MWIHKDTAVGKMVNEIIAAAKTPENQINAV